MQRTEGQPAPPLACDRRTSGSVQQIAKGSIAADLDASNLDVDALRATQREIAPAKADGDTCSRDRATGLRQRRANIAEQEAIESEIDGSDGAGRCSATLAGEGGRRANLLAREARAHRAGGAEAGQNSERENPGPGRHDLRRIAERGMGAPVFKGANDKTPART